MVPWLVCLCSTVVLSVRRGHPPAPWSITLNGRAWGRAAATAGLATPLSASPPSATRYRFGCCCCSPSTASPGPRVCICNLAPLRSSQLLSPHSHRKHAPNMRHSRPPPLPPTHSITHCARLVQLQTLRSSLADGSDIALVGGSVGVILVDNFPASNPVLETQMARGVRISAGECVVCLPCEAGACLSWPRKGGGGLCAGPKWWPLVPPDTDCYVEP